MYGVLHLPPHSDPVSLRHHLKAYEGTGCLLTMIMRLWSLMIDETLRLDKGTAIDSGAYHVYLAKAHFFLFFAI